MAKEISSMLHLPPDRLRNILTAIQSRLPELNFITIHYAYFIFTCLFSGLIFWGSSTPFGSVSFIDSIFLTTSAMTEAGLNTVNLSQLNTWQQVMLFILIMMGSTIFVSAFVLLVRLKAFSKAFRYVEEEKSQTKLNRRTSGLSKARSFFVRSHQPSSVDLDALNKSDDKLTSSEEERIISQNTIPPEPVSFDSTTGSDGKAIDGEAPGRARSELKHPDNDNREEEEEEEEQQQQHESLYPNGISQPSRDQNNLSTPMSPLASHIGFSEDTRFGRRNDEAYRKLNKPMFSFTGVGVNATSTLRSRSSSPSRRLSLPRAAPLPTTYNASTNPYFTSGGWIARNSQFHGLTNEERLKLGGCEYRAVLFLSFLVPFYFVIWQLLGAIALGAYVQTNRASTAEANGFSPFWVGSFNAISAFNNSGMSLLDANMVAFQNSIFMLLSMGLLILAGNTAFPIFLRAAVWWMWKLIPADDPSWYEDKRTLRFLLDHPRRVYTNMFPSRHTWWLAAALIVLNGIDWAFFPILNIGNPQIVDVLSPGLETIDGLFQALAVRSGGFYVVPIPTLRIALQFLYVIMMYISAYPVVISMRNSNVYEERSLGVFAEDIQDSDLDGKKDAKLPYTDTSASGQSRFQLGTLKRRLTNFSEKATTAPKRETTSYFVRYQLRAQLAHDAWFLVFAVFLILIIEASQFESHPIWFSVFNVIFEVVSGYATVGISVGVPYNAFSFCGSWHTLSKLILIVVMLRGRHRGLPVAIDHAVQLPGFRLYNAENEDGEQRLDRIERSYSMRNRSSTLSDKSLDNHSKPTAETETNVDGGNEATTTARGDEAANLRKPYLPRLSANG